jgi:hypothetical protein
VSLALLLARRVPLPVIDWKVLTYHIPETPVNEIQRDDQKVATTVEQQV